MGGGWGDLTLTQGKLWVANSWILCGRLLSFNTKTQIIQVGVKSRKTQTACTLYKRFILQGEKSAVFSSIFDPLPAALAIHHVVNLYFSPHFCTIARVRRFCVRLYAHNVAARGGRGAGGSYIRFGRGGAICLTCWGRRLEGKTPNVFSITLSSRSCSNWFIFFLSTHWSVWPGDSWEGGVEKCHYQAKDSNSHM